MPDSRIASALALRQSHPAAPPGDVLALVFTGSAGASIDFGPASLPPHPFALLVAEGFDDPLTPAEWIAFLPLMADPAPVLEHFAATTWARFLKHYGLA
jgi:hypothetical protein